MLGFAAAGAGGYYLYSAGGDPEAAKNKMKSMSTSINYLQSAANHYPS